MFFDWKIQLEKIQLTRDLSDNTMIYQGIRLPCKTIKAIVTLQHEHKQQLFGSRRHMYNISSSKNTRSYDKISRKIFYTINSI